MQGIYLINTIPFKNLIQITIESVQNINTVNNSVSFMLTLLLEYNRLAPQLTNLNISSTLLILSTETIEQTQANLLTTCSNIFDVASVIVTNAYNSTAII